MKKLLLAALLFTGCKSDYYTGCVKNGMDRNTVIKNCGYPDEYLDKSKGKIKVEGLLYYTDYLHGYFGGKAAAVFLQDDKVILISNL